jgi:hypothetical protein
MKRLVPPCLKNQSCKVRPHFGRAAAGGDAKPVG